MTTSQFSTDSRSSRSLVVLAIVLAALCAGLLALGSGTARADISYCNKLVPPKSACDRTSGWTRMQANIASYSGWPSIDVCQKVYRITDHAQVSRTCGYIDTMSGDLSYYFYYNIKLNGHAGNDSNYTHTINGNTWSDEASLMATVPPSMLSVPSSLSALRTSAASDGSVTALRGRADGANAVRLETTNRGLCLTVEGTGGTCTPPEHGATGRTMGVSVCGPNQAPDDVIAYGIVPDGVTAVEVKGEDGATLLTAPVTSNTYRFSLSKQAAAKTATLAWVGKTGTSALGDLMPDDLSCD